MGRLWKLHLRCVVSGTMTPVAEQRQALQGLGIVALLAMTLFSSCGSDDSDSTFRVRNECDRDAQFFLDDIPGTQSVIAGETERFATIGDKPSTIGMVEPPYNGIVTVMPGQTVVIRGFPCIPVIEE